MICLTLGDDCEALHFGAISLIPSPCGETYEALLDREAAKRVISLDPNIRPGFIKDKPRTWPASSAWPPSPIS